MLTAKDAELDKVLGLELGADDYVTKPFSPGSGGAVKPLAGPCTRWKKWVKFHLPDLVVDTGRMEVTVNKKTIDLTYRSTCC